MNKRDAKIIALKLIVEEMGFDLVDWDSPWRQGYTEIEQEKIEDAVCAIEDTLKARLARLKAT